MASSRSKRRLDVVAFGEILWDAFEGKRAKREPIGRDFRFTLGGASANVATVLARMGARSAVIGGVGQDRFGDALAQHLEGDGVDTRFLIRLPKRTGLTFVTRNARGEPAFLPYRQGTADASIDAEHVTAAMQKAIGGATWVVVGTSTMITPSLAAATDAFLRTAKDGGARLVVDLNVRAHLWPGRDAMQAAAAHLVRDAAIVQCSFDDLVALTGRRDILWLADHAPRAAWVVTQGAKGASAIGDHGFVARPAVRATQVDATGAGDAFLAGILSVLLAARAVPGEPAWRDPGVWTAALDVAHRLGAKAVSKVGAVEGVLGLAAVRARVRNVERRSARAK